MGDPRNPRRADEKWPEDRFKIMKAEVERLAPFVTFSGGWAWHFMSPPHDEYKLLHDHKDVDIFVMPENYPVLLTALNRWGYVHEKTKYDHGSFYRWVKYFLLPTPMKVILDVFLRKVPFIAVNGINVVEPNTLIGFYGEIHQTDDCVAVIAAKKLLDKGISPVLRPELVTR